MRVAHPGRLAAWHRALSLRPYDFVGGCPGSWVGDLFFMGKCVMGHQFSVFLTSGGISFQKRGSGGASVFAKGASAEPKTLFLEGIKRNQLPPLKF